MFSEPVVIHLRCFGAQTAEGVTVFIAARFKCGTVNGSAERFNEQTYGGPFVQLGNQTTRLYPRVLVSSQLTSQTSSSGLSSLKSQRRTVIIRIISELRPVMSEPAADRGVSDREVGRKSSNVSAPKRHSAIYQSRTLKISFKKVMSVKRSMSLGGGGHWIPAERSQVESRQ